MKLTAEDLEEINPEVWAEGGKSGLLNIPPIEVKMQPGTPPIRIKQYPMSLEGKKGLIPIIEQLLKEGILEPCMSPHNTPILAVKKAEGKYRLVQDLREINKRTITKHPVVPNPYNLLSQIPQEHAWFTIIDLKDAFWACPLAEGSRDWFAFEWDHPETKRRQQLRWTRLPQGFTESPNLFGQALERLLEQFTPEGQVQILQYVDDLLISGENQLEVRTTSIKLLNFLGEKGLKVSKRKLQFVKPEVTYLGHLIGKGYKKLSPERIAGIIAIPAPKTKRDIRKLLGLFGYCRHWIDEYTQNVRFLYDKLVSPEPIEWTQEDEKQLEKLKNKLSTAPVLSLPDLKKEFDLFVNTEGGVAYGVLAQEWGGCKKPIAFLSKILDPVARGWPACLQAVAATAVLVEESQKLTLNGKIQIHTPHDIKTVLSQKAPGWVTDSRILKYEITLINSENLRLTVSKNLNPAQFLSGEPPPDLEHDCLELMSLQTKVLLMTEAAIRTKEREWIHANRIKGPVDEPKEWTITSEPGDTKLTLKRRLSGFELQEEKVQRMPPWKYLGLEIGKRTIVPQEIGHQNKGLNPPIIRHFGVSSLFSIRERPPVMVRDPESEGRKGHMTWSRGDVDTLACPPPRDQGGFHPSGEEHKTKHRIQGAALPVLSTGENHCPGPAGHTNSDTSQDVIGLLGYLGTQLAHIQTTMCTCSPESEPCGRIIGAPYVSWSVRVCVVSVLICVILECVSNLYLKDAFFCLPLHEASQKIFAFEWESPKTGRKTQLAWCVLPQGYKNSPTIFGEQLAKDLESWEPPPGEGQLLQYVDDLLIATQTQETCVDWTRNTSQDDVEIIVTNIVNPASILSRSMGEPVIHDCLETTEATYSSRPDLKDTPLEDAETWFTDGSSYVISRRRHAGYAVTTSKEVIESGPLISTWTQVKKPDGSYRLVQDLREVNKRTRSPYPVVPNPYTLLSKVPPQHQWFSVVDLKDAFGACHLAKESQDIFAFEWENPKTGRKQQLRWAKLPQGFTESPNLSGQALEKILQAFSTPPGIQIIQYVDYLLLSGEVEVREATIKLLNFLGEKGLRASKGKLQFAEPEVKYLGHLISKGSRRLNPERIAGILSLPPPSSKREIRKLLGLLGYCKLWIEGYTQAVKFLYEKLTEGDNIKWTKEDDDKLEKLKLKLASIPALSLPSLEKPFHLYMNVEKGIAHGVLVQEWGGVKRPVAYLSKMLDPVSHGWPVCIQAIAATAILVEESRKPTFGGFRSGIAKSSGLVNVGSISRETEVVCREGEGEKEGKGKVGKEKETIISIQIIKQITINQNNNNNQ
ncbi:hypothetical protein DUI87_18997 [Hirundo rustica rustica]|uniref:ribonuclease H n=1 Tax=Hirundo rustica rustica TaxID=333673 RepID=A0A3M0JTC0_HIRRU|nr:hypothetical protein DUI87_18997 [Hirundo rustica rustica]